MRIVEDLNEAFFLVLKGNKYCPKCGEELYSYSTESYKSEIHAPGCVIGRVLSSDFQKKSQLLSNTLVELKIYIEDIIRRWHITHKYGLAAIARRLKLSLED